MDRQDAGKLHTTPSDIKQALRVDSNAQNAWESLTPLARNEWICWIITVKKPETRKNHINRLIKELGAGKRRPCCWAGCPHRNPNAKKWFSRMKSSQST